MTLKNKLLVAGLSLGVVLLGFFWVQTFRLLKDERTRVSQYYDLFKENESKVDSLRHRSDSVDIVLAKYKYIIDSLDVIVAGSTDQIDYLNKELNKALEDIQSVSANENYEWLQKVIPTRDTLEFPFAGDQVTRLAQEVVGRQYMDSLYGAQVDITLLKQAQLGYKDEIIKTLRGERKDLNGLAEELYIQLDAKLEDLQKSEAEMARLKKALSSWRVGGISGGAFLILLLLLI